MSQMTQTIESRLRAVLAPDLLEVEDFSAEHAGHAGSRPGGETHFRIRIESGKFRGLSRVQQHQLVYAALARELQDSIHALQIDSRAPDGA